MTVTIVGLREKDFARIRRTLPAMDLRHAGTDFKRAALAGIVVALTRFSPHGIQERARSLGCPLVLHRGGMKGLIDLLRGLGKPTGG